MPTTKTKTATCSEITRVYVAQHRQDTMYARGQWYRYVQGVWLPHHDVNVDNEMLHLMEVYEGTDNLRPSVQVLSSLLRFSRSRLFVSDEDVDGYPSFVNMTNGIYDLDTGNLIDHSPDYHLTTQLPFPYDPTAQCPFWQIYLLTTMTKTNSKEHDPQLAEFLQEAVGYSLTTDVSHHVTFWCYGEGANGKGVLFHVLEKLAGDGGTNINVGLLRKEQYQLATLAGKRLAMCSEAGSTDNLVEDAIIKALVAGDAMQVRMIRKEPFVLHPTAKLWWSMNELPAVADTSRGFWRRVRIIPFNRYFADQEQIKDLKQKLEMELPGIFNWAMAGLRRVRKAGRFTEPVQVLGATDQYRRESNTVLTFTEEMCVVDNGEYVKSSEIYAAYTAWCKQSGFKPHSIKNFKHEMERLRFWYGQEAGKGRHYQGLRLKNPFEVLNN